jgi:anti-sigma B factor antagonist
MIDVADLESPALAVNADSVGISLFAETVHANGAATVFVRGDVDLASAPALRSRLFELLCLPIERLTLDLSELDFIDSSGLQVLNDVRKHTAAHDVRFALASVPRCAQRVLEITDMDGLFDYD